MNVAVGGKRTYQLAAEEGSQDRSKQSHRRLMESAQTEDLSGDDDLMLLGLTVHAISGVLALVRSGISRAPR